MIRVRDQVIDRVSIEWANTRAKEIVKAALKNADNYRSDPERENRLEENECLVCFYRKGRVGGCAVTTVVCAICKREMTFGSTATDLLCNTCANKNGLCKQCGSDIELKSRKSERPYECASKS